MDSTDSSAASQHPHLPPGFRFHPTDEELVVHYLKKKAASIPLPVTIIAEIELYKFDPWELPSKATFGMQEWYFFTPRDRKYPNGARPNRAAISGYWKATGTDKPVLTSNGTQKVGVKKALVFYGGKPPKGIKTNWIMHEYRLVDNNPSSKPHPDPVTKIGSLRLDDWVLCRIYKKNNSARPMEKEKDDSTDDQQMFVPSPIMGGNINNQRSLSASKGSSNFGALLDQEENFLEGILTASTKTDMSSSMMSQPVKPMIPTQYYWTESPAKRFHDGENGSSSFVSLLNQIPRDQDAGNSFHPNTPFGSLADGVLRQNNYQLPSMNWDL